MASQVRRYTSSGLVGNLAERHLPAGVTVTAAGPFPFRFVDVTISDDSAAQDLDDYMAGYGCVFVEADPPAPGALTIVQTAPVVLAVDADVVEPADGWVDVLTTSISSKGGTSARVEAFVVVAGTGSGKPQARLLLNGSVVGPVVVDVPNGSAGSVSLWVPVGIPVTGGYVAYAVKLQVRSPSVLTTATPLAGCVLTVAEYRQ